MVQVIDSITTVVRESSKIAKPRQTRQARRPVAELYAQLIDWTDYGADKAAVDAIVMHEVTLSTS